MLKKDDKIIRTAGFSIFKQEQWYRVEKCTHASKFSDRLTDAYTVRKLKRTNYKDTIQ